MADRTRLWRIAFALSVIVNVGGGIIALIGGEGGHAMLHLLGLLITSAFWPKVAGSARPAIETTDLPQVDSQLDQLQHSVDAIALEVERIGEAQRYAARILKEKIEKAKQG